MEQAFLGPWRPKEARPSPWPLAQRGGARTRPRWDLSAVVAVGLPMGGGAQARSSVVLRIRCPPSLSSVSQAALSTQVLRRLTNKDGGGGEGVCGGGLAWNSRWPQELEDSLAPPSSHPLRWIQTPMSIWGDGERRDVPSRGLC